MDTCETAYRRVFDAWFAGQHASALEFCRDLLRRFPEGRAFEQCLRA
jgi:hypothetical protein